MSLLRTKLIWTNCYEVIELTNSATVVVVVVVASNAQKIAIVRVYVGGRKIVRRTTSIE